MSAVLHTETITVIRGADAVLKAVSVPLYAGEVLGILGENGVGKSTLLMAMAGLVSLRSGRIMLMDKPLQEHTLREKATCISYLPQRMECHWPLPVERVVALGRLPHLAPMQALGAEDAQIVDNALSLTDTLHLKHRNVMALSGGERARVLLARALASDPKILLTDEPVSSLDAHHQLTVMGLLRERARLGTAVAVVLHDMALAARFCDRIVLLHKGEVLSHGTPYEVLNDANIEKALGVQVARPLVGEHYIPLPLHPING